MIKPNSHLEKMLKGIAAKKKLKPEDALTEMLTDYYKKVIGKSYLI